MARNRWGDTARTRRTCLLLVGALATAGCVGAVDRESFDDAVHSRGWGMNAAMVEDAFAALRDELGTREIALTALRVEPQTVVMTALDQLDPPGQQTWRYEFRKLREGFAVSTPLAPDDLASVTFSPPDLPIEQFGEMIDAALSSTGLTDATPESVTYGRANPDRTGPIRVEVAVRNSRTEASATFDSDGDLLGTGSGTSSFVPADPSATTPSALIASLIAALAPESTTDEPKLLSIEYDLPARRDSPDGSGFEPSPTAYVEFRDPNRPNGISVAVFDAQSGFYAVPEIETSEEPLDTQTFGLDDFDIASLDVIARSALDDSAVDGATLTQLYVRRAQNRNGPLRIGVSVTGNDGRSLVTYDPDGTLLEVRIDGVPIPVTSGDGEVFGVDDLVRDALSALVERYGVEPRLLEVTARPFGVDVIISDPAVPENIDALSYGRVDGLSGPEPVSGLGFDPSADAFFDANAIRIGRLDSNIDIGVATTDIAGAEFAFVIVNRPRIVSLEPGLTFDAPAQPVGFDPVALRVYVTSERASGSTLLAPDGTILRVYR